MTSLEQAATTLGVLAHPLRLKIIERLNGREATVSELAAELRRSHAVVSQHLNRLKLHGIVRRRPQGAAAYYTVSDADAAAILEWIHRREFAKASFRDGEAI